MVYVVTVNGHEGFVSYVVKAETEVSAKEKVSAAYGWLGFGLPTVETLDSYMACAHVSVLRIAAE